MGNERKIRVGLIMPQKEYDMDKETIYIGLRMYGSSISARAVSREKFKYIDRAIAGNILDCEENNATTEGSSRQEGLPIVTLHHQEFIKMLAQENNGKVEDRCFEDGLEVLARLENVRNVSHLNLSR